MRLKQVKSTQGTLPTLSYNKTRGIVMIMIHTKCNRHQLQSCQAASHPVSLLLGLIKPILR